MNANQALKVGIMGLAAWPVPMQEGKISAPQSIIYNLIAGLKERGVEVILFAGEDSSTKAELESAGKFSADHEFGPELSKPIVFTERKIEYDMILAREALKAYDEGRIDVLNSHDIRYNPYLFAGQELPVIYTPHFNLETRYHEYDKYRYELMKNSQNLSVANISNHNNRFCESLGLRVSGNVANGIDTDIFVPNMETERKGLLLVGRMVPGKKIKEAVEIATSLGEDITLIGPMGAKDSEKQYFEELEKDYLSRSNVNYLGAMFGSELIAQYQQAKVLIYPSESEGLPLGILEAMSTGMPVVASNVRGVPDIITDGSDGFIVDGFEESIWKEKIQKALLLDSDRVRQKIVDNFSLDKMVDRYLAAYYNVVGR